MDEARKRVLIVDDEESIRNILGRKLETEGYECVVKSDGKEALDTASTQHFDLVLTDVKMPGLSGIDVLTQIMADHPDTAVILITAVANTQTAVEAMKLGAHDYVIKPFDLDDLSMRITRALEGKRLAIENREYQADLEQKVTQQVDQVRQYYREAIHALADGEAVIESLDSEQPKGRADKIAGRNVMEASRESPRPARDLVEQLAQLPDNEAGADFGTAMELAKVLALMAETREPYARGHSERVSMLANEIASQIGCPDDMVQDLQLAAVVHDVGKIVVPDNILFKPGALTPAEHNEVKRHPVASAGIIRHINSFTGIVPMVESHHEWFNGKGYPNKLRGESIPLGARILAVADAYDAITCSRPHRARLDDEEAVQLLKKGAGKQWDPAIVDALLQVLERESQLLQGASP
ncbi:MAG: HD domain-containing phosphohydrolase [Dehalococcoidia bacterium]